MNKTKFIILIAVFFLLSVLSGKAADALYYTIPDGTGQSIVLPVCKFEPTSDETLGYIDISRYIDPFDIYTVCI